VLPVVEAASESANGHGVVFQDQERAKQLGRDLHVHTPQGDPAAEVIRLARENQTDLIVLPLTQQPPAGQSMPLDALTLTVLRQAHCRVFLAAPPVIPHETDKE
jgi:nucleotide-binding universal stress UspA family protein